MRRMIRALTAVVMLMAMLLSSVGRGPAYAVVTQVEGSAYGYFSNLSLFGGSPSTRGPSPAVTLPATGSASPITRTAATGDATYGPARVFSSGRLNVSTQGTTGATGSVTSAVTIQSVNTSGQEVFTAASVASSCKASESGVTSATTITGGTLQTSEGDPNVAGDETVIQVPTNPAPNTTYDGQVESTGDSFRYVFNERIVDPNDGSITVNAAHQYFLGPTAVGELIIGQSVCGLTAVPDDTPPSARITAPAARATVKQGVPVRVAADDADAGVKVVQVRYCPGTRCVFARGRKVGADTAAPYVVRWRNQPKNGTYTLVARVTDRAGNTTLSKPVTVRVKN